MDDELVGLVTDDFKDLAFANGIGAGSLHPIMDGVVNRLRNWGMEDEHILAALVPPESQDEEPQRGDDAAPNDEAGA